ncbi:hypothetical protein [Allorhizocola rhizosphaerae]|uniref:hypothetical protein n=1 Tax=Allorhizocola rhizosphaerae TaxID=1872709 RepID=UPI0013C36640|nr:hypothetical protein [Allorhizocola rhizosphaerae]
MSTRSLWWTIAGAWGVLLVILGAWSSFRSPATTREQRDLGQAKATVDQVVGRLSGNVPADWRLFDEGYREEPCEVSLVRDGVLATRGLALSGPVGSESGAISRLASTLDGASLRPGEGSPEGFFADAGEFVAVRGSITAPGSITIQIKTGCRPR